MKRDLIQFCNGVILACVVGLCFTVAQYRVTPVVRAQSFADTCAGDVPPAVAQGDLIRAWTIECVIRANRIAQDALAVANRADGLNRDEVYALFFGTASGQDWQHNIIKTAEDDWRMGRRSLSFLGDYTRLRQCQFGRANYYELGSAFKTVCPP